MSTIRTTIGTLRRAINLHLISEMGRFRNNVDDSTVTIEREIPSHDNPDDWDVIEITVEYSAHGSHIPSSWDGPEEFPEVELGNATLADGTPVELTADEERRVIELAEEYISNNPPGPDEAYDSYRDYDY